MCILGSASAKRETVGVVNVEMGRDSCEVCLLLRPNASSSSEGRGVAVSSWRAPTKSIFVFVRCSAMALSVVLLQYRQADARNSEILNLIKYEKLIT